MKLSRIVRSMKSLFKIMRFALPLGTLQAISDRTIGGATSNSQMPVINELACVIRHQIKYCVHICNSFLRQLMMITS